MLITKSKFIAGVQCLKRLYFIVHSPELRAQPDESGQSIIEQGRDVGLLASVDPCPFVRATLQDSPASF
jgi:hypothetical protein